jgi:hypothetical protein
MTAVLLTALLAAVVYGGNPCDPVLRAAAARSSLPLCTEYGDATLSSDERLVVFSEHETEVTGTDTAHRVHLAILERDSAADGWRVVDREDITDLLLDNGDPGSFERLAVFVENASIGDRRVVHLSLLSGISGSGAISRADDLFYLVAASKLRRVALLEGTAAWWRSGDRKRGETSSTLRVVGAQLVWDRSERIAGTNGDVVDVTCRDERRVYRWDEGALVPLPVVAEDDHLLEESTTLGRFDLRSTIDCASTKRPPGAID